MTRVRGFLVAILGPTASGKTKLSVALAKRLNAQIVSLDSIQAYRDAPILSAQASPEEQDGVPHYMVDYLGPQEEPHDFVQQAARIIRMIIERGGNVIVVGGSISLSLPLLLHANVRALKPRILTLHYNWHLACSRIQARFDEQVSAGLQDELVHLWNLEQRHQPKHVEQHGVWKSIGYQQFRPWLAQPRRRTGNELWTQGARDIIRSTQDYALNQMEFIEEKILPACAAVKYSIHRLHLTQGPEAWSNLLYEAEKACTVTLQERGWTRLTKL